MTEQNFWNSASIWRLVIGVVMIMLGLYVWFNPMVSLVALALYIGIAFIIVGSGYIISSFSYESGWELLVGLLDAFIGVILISNLGLNTAGLPIVLAVWCLSVGIIQVVTAWRREHAGVHWVWSLVVGVLGMIFAFLILSYPTIGLLTLNTAIGLYLVLYGIFSMTEYFCLPHDKDKQQA